MVRDAPILLLDEPTSGLDLGSEAVIIEAIRRVAQNRTVVMVSHRLKLAASADRVVVLDGGRVVEQGAPAALLAAGGAFARLWAQQSLPITANETDEAVCTPRSAHCACLPSPGITRQYTSNNALSNQV
jgi:ABC-type transport system involved in cytochrome bd biosynthesis fused ATPase/permease subunit